MVPEAAVLVIGDDHHHAAPLRAAAQPVEEAGDMRIAAGEVGVGRVLGQPPDRLVEGHRRQGALIDVAHKIVAVLEMGGAIGGARRKPRLIIERLVMRREIWGVVVPRVDDTALFVGGPAAVGERQVPAAGIPRPADPLCRQGVPWGRRERDPRRVPAGRRSADRAAGWC